MKSLFSLIFLFFFANSAFAANLCDTSCNLTITFPTSGTITAVEPLTFTFGDSGLVNTGATSTSYILGSILDLGAGDVLAFEAGGSFVLGTGGNIAYTNMSIDTTGDITIEAIGGAGTITISDMSIVAGSITLNSDTTIENNLSIPSLSNTVILSGSGVLTISSSGSLTTGYGAVILVGINDLSASVANITPATEITIDGVLYQIEYKTVDGEQVAIVTAPDGTAGTLEFKDGAFVFVPDPKEESSGTVGLLAILSLLITPILLRRQEGCLFIR